MSVLQKKSLKYFSSWIREFNDASINIGVVKYLSESDWINEEKRGIGRAERRGQC